MLTPRVTARGFSAEATGAATDRPTCQAAAVLSSGRAPRILNPTVKGGMSAMAKKAAKGGKKKAGKKR
jgi:hypothetical protein